MKDSKISGKIHVPGTVNILRTIFAIQIPALMMATATKVYISPSSYECGNTEATVPGSPFTNEITLSVNLNTMKCSAIKWRLYLPIKVSVLCIGEMFIITFERHRQKYTPSSVTG